MQQILFIDEGIDVLGIEIRKMRHTFGRHRIAESANRRTTALVLLITSAILELGSPELDDPLHYRKHGGAKQIVATHLQADAGVLKPLEAGCVLLHGQLLQQIRNSCHRHLWGMRNGLYLRFAEAMRNASPKRAAQSGQRVVDDIQRSNGVLHRS